MYRTLLLLWFVLLSGCQFRGESRPLSAEVPPPPTLVDAPAHCIAARARFGLGRLITAALLDEMRMRTGAHRARLVVETDPDTPFDASRLLVDIEPKGRVVGMRCG
ncbi:hypothetical protein H4CHR_05263 [Variovorax sp. PBS-H4]|uniref:hypothetical protein n=1 Tax=Variovorax sp. PBS-H4 TaxID=434008 RepID=UPI001316F7C7|nr:hypothetical protein [Variovorax sp. PBS-H4]VTU40542.1 hypothetical protein H4CHR_05263 [Variovorax sp. PBS-H4]